MLDLRGLCTATSPQCLHGVSLVESGQTLDDTARNIDHYQKNVRSRLQAAVMVQQCADVARLAGHQASTLTRRVSAQRTHLSNLATILQKTYSLPPDAPLRLCRKPGAAPAYKVVPSDCLSRMWHRRRYAEEVAAMRAQLASMCDRHLIEQRGSNDDVASARHVVTEQVARTLARRSEARLKLSGHAASHALATARVKKLLKNELGQPVGPRTPPDEVNQRLTTERSKAAQALWLIGTIKQDLETADATRFDRLASRLCHTPSIAAALLRWKCNGRFASAAPLKREFHREERFLQPARGQGRVMSDGLRARLDQLEAADDAANWPPIGTDSPEDVCRRREAAIDDLVIDLLLSHPEHLHAYLPAGPAHDADKPGRARAFSIA